MRIYNTLTRKIEEFRPISPPFVGIYSCGPTVYDYSHIGHFRTYVNTDILKRTLSYFGFEVKHVMNITDVGHLISDSDVGEDKMEKGAKREGKTVWEIAEFYTGDFFEAMKKLNIIMPTVIAKATDHIKEMIIFVSELEKNGFTYILDDGVYFDTSKLINYGRLAGQNLDDLKAGARVEMVKGKKNATDFALWKLSRSSLCSSGQAPKRQMEWDSPWGKGFPGWHIECSAMSKKYLGEEFDIHTGGVDHIPIHHTNEIAQSEGNCGKLPARYWFHNAFLMVDGQKMSKSLGNIYNQNDIFQKGFTLMDARYLFLGASYRDPMNFTWESLKSAAVAYKNLRSIIDNLIKTKNERMALSEDKLDKIKVFSERFREALENDLNVSSALAVLWQVLKSNIPSEDKLDLAFDFDQVFGLNLRKKESVLEAVPDELQKLLIKRDKLRLEKKWKEADVVRDEILEKGFEILDAKDGSRIVKR